MTAQCPKRDISIVIKEKEEDVEYEEEIIQPNEEAKAELLALNESLCYLGLIFLSDYTPYFVPPTTLSILPLNNIEEEILMLDDEMEIEYTKVEDDNDYYKILPSLDVSPHANCTIEIDDISDSLSIVLVISWQSI